MKIKLKETTEREVEVTLPAYRKSKSRLVKVISEHEFIGVDKEGKSYYHQKWTMFDTSEYFKDDYQVATEYEFYRALATAYTRLGVDMGVVEEEKTAA